jgi:putative colanic acid biosynthesis UDP-glucose lipid carrier transferase
MGDRPGFVQSHHTAVTLLQRLSDAVLIGIAHWLACLVHPDGEVWEVRHTVATAFAVIVFSLLAEAGNLYRPWRGSPLKSEIGRVWSIWLFTAPLLLFLAFLLKSSEDYSRLVVLTWFIFAPLLISAWRLSVRLSLRQARASGRNSRSVAIAGATTMGADLAGRILSNDWAGMRLIGYYDDRAADRAHPMPEELGEVSGSLDDLVEDAKNGKIDLVYIAMPLRAERRINDVVRRLADTTASVYVVADFFVFDLLHAQWANVHGLPVVSIFESPFWGVDGWLKRLEDIVLGSLIMCVIAIPMAIIALGVKLTSKGPVLFRQRRYGLNGEEIHVLKFRSMTCCDDGDSIKQATQGDKRITPFGAFLRRTSLDELPQFFHVLSGKMSIVGPRPHAVAHNEQYRRIIHGYMLRHKVKPGITGWAQVNGWRGETDTIEKMEKRVEHDLDYIRNWGVLLDLKIIALTVFGSSVRKNAY